jgi:hypothetical protein
MAIQRCLGPDGPQFGSKARQTAQEKFSIAATADRYESIYAAMRGLPQARVATT